MIGSRRALRRTSRQLSVSGGTIPPRCRADSRGSLRRARGILSCLGLVVWGLNGCAGGLEPYKPRRPSASYRAPQLLFSERTLLEPRIETPAQTLARIEAVFQEVAEVEDPDDRGIRAELDAEVDSIRAAVDRLDLGAASIMRLRLGTPNAEEIEQFHRAAGLYTRWALARMRAASADDRVRGAELLEEARTFDASDPILATVQATYLDMAGFRSNAIRALDEYEMEYGIHELVELSRYRKNLRQWTLTGFPEYAQRARRLGDEMVTRSGGWNQAPSWALMEMARFYFLSDSLERAEEIAAEIGRKEGPEPGDGATAARAELLLGLIEVRRLEHARASPHFALALQAASITPSLEWLSLLLRIPWDLWSDEEQAEYDRSLSQAEWVQKYWRDYDPIRATPRLFEGHIDYQARVAEALLRFDDVDLRRSGPLTEPGRAVLRFGWPDLWERLGGTPPPGAEDDVAFDFAVHPTWRFDYEWTPGTGRRKEIRFQDRSGARGYFVAQDSLRPPGWPYHRFDEGFLGRAYPFDSNVARFRSPEGRTRVFLSFDTVLPNYSVRFPLQGVRYEGEVTVETALLRAIGADTWILQGERAIVLDREQVEIGVREFRRRSGQLVLDYLETGRYRLPSFLRLRDERSRTLHVGIENGFSFEVEGFGSDAIESSDILITSALEGIVQTEVEREITPGWVAYGPDPDAFDIWPRASRKFLVGEDLAYYLELYNLAQRQGVATVDIEVSLQKLDPEGEIEYEVILGESKDSLIKFGVRQWNIARSFGLGALEPGTYRLAIEAFDRVGRRKVQRQADFEVVLPDELMVYYRWARLPAPPRTDPPGG